jgi:hypothetical protein
MKNFLENIICRLQKAFSPTVGGDTQTFLCLFLKYDTDFIFLTPSKEEGIAKNYKPLIIPISSLGKIEENFCIVNEYMINEFDISPDKIQIAKEFISFYPIKNEIYYFAVIDLALEDLQELKKRSYFGCFQNIPLPYAYLNADKNIFFQILVKFVNDFPYIISTI